MKAGVPEFLRKRALRVLWRSNPVLANLDGLNDYDDDFRSPELTRKVIATGYKIGRGFLRDQPEPELPQDDANPQEDDASDSSEVLSDDQIPSDAMDPPAIDRADQSEENVDEGDFPFHPKRMKFRT